MKDIYENYYWQNDKIRLRLWHPKDNADSADDIFDSTALTFLQEEIVLPLPNKKIDLNDEQKQPNDEAPAFSIENLQGSYVGHIHFNYINERHGTFSIGLIISKEHRGKGYGKASMQLLLEYAFNERRLHKFNGDCLDDNRVSAIMMESLGCKLEGIIRDAAYINGKYHNKHLYGLTEDEYRSIITSSKKRDK